MHEGGPPARFGDAAAERLAERWVGRESLLESLLPRLRQGPLLISLVGLPGVGKTALASMLQRSARSARWVWCEHLRTMAELDDALGDLAAFGAEQPALLVVDAFEHLGELGERFLRERLAHAGGRLCVCITSRERLSVPGALQAIHHEVRVEPLSEVESVTYLRRRGIEEDVDALVQVAAGMPLALALAAEAGRDWAVDEARDVVTSLALEVLSSAPDEAYREALYASSIVAVDRARLEVALECDTAALFDWLRARSFMRRTDQGLVPHEVVRDALYADLSTRRRALLDKLAGRLVHAMLLRVADGTPDSQRRAYLESLQARRDLVPMRMALSVDAISRTSLHILDRSTLAHAADLVERHEGASSRRAFEGAYGRTPGGFFCTRNARQEIVGLFAEVQLGVHAEHDDPLLAEAERIFAEHPEWHAEGAGLVRWMLGAAGYQAPTPELSSVMASGPFITSSLRPLRRRELFVVHQPDEWEALAHVMMLTRVPSPTVQLGGRSYGFFLVDHAAFTGDWRTPAQLRVQSTRLLVKNFTGLRAPTPLLDRAQMEEAVRHALANLARPEELETNPMFQSRAALDAAVSQLASVPSQEDWMAAVRQTYLEPAVKQRAAAAELGIPFGTYRYRLRQGIDALVEHFWREQNRS